MQQQPTKFNFDTVFGTKGGSQQQTAPRARSAYSADEVETIRKDTFAKGKADAQAHAATMHAAAIAAVAQRLTELVSTLDGTIETLRHESVEFALQIARQLAGTALSAHPAEEIEALVADCLHKLHREPRIVVRVPEPVAETLRADIDGLCAKHGYNGRVVVLAEPGITGADCRIEWADGGAERDFSEAFAAIEQCAARWRNSSSSDET